MLSAFSQQPSSQFGGNCGVCGSAILAHGCSQGHVCSVLPLQPARVASEPAGGLLHPRLSPGGVAEQSVAPPVDIGTVSCCGLSRPLRILPARRSVSSPGQVVL